MTVAESSGSSDESSYSNDNNDQRSCNHDILEPKVVAASLMMVVDDSHSGSYDDSISGNDSCCIDGVSSADDRKCGVTSADESSKGNGRRLTMMIESGSNKSDTAAKKRWQHWQ